MPYITLLYIEDVKFWNTTIQINICSLHYTFDIYMSENSWMFHIIPLHMI